MAVFAIPDATLCLYTTLRNTSGAAMYFGFLPPHGRTLDDGEEISVFGDVTSLFRGQPANNRAKRSFEAALDAGNLAIIKTPAVHLYDETLDQTKMLTLDNDSFAVADPCWGSYSSV